MKVSIIVPVYNTQWTIKKAIDSVLNQNFPRRDYEIIVINDGSTDNTLKILKSYQRQIRIINQENQGALKAANRGFKAAQGEYLIKLDSDDYFKPNILKEMASALDKNIEIDFVYCDYYEKSTRGKLKAVSTKDNIFNTIGIGILFKKNKFAKEGFFNEGIKFAEYDLLLRTQNKWKGYCIVKPLFYYNRRKGSITGNKQWVRDAIGQLKKIYPQKLKEIKKIRKY